MSPTYRRSPTKLYTGADIIDAARELGEQPRLNELGHFLITGTFGSNNRR
jgi:hypothetical protein